MAYGDRILPTLFRTAKDFGIYTRFASECISTWAPSGATEPT